MIFNQLKNSVFIKEILEKDGQVFIVGGAVRDNFLKLPIKDIDLLVTGIELQDLETILKQSGKAELVGKSFGVIKFKTDQIDLDEPIDVALPRTDVKIGDGHKGFEVKVDHNLPIETDLHRRDFTINAMAINLSTNELIDPFDGLKDIKSKTLRMVNEFSFIEDALRMMRGLQFASRFEGFEFDPLTFEKIQENAHLIKEISGERIFMELEKIVSKNGDMDKALNLLNSSGIFNEFFNVQNYINKFKKLKKSRLDFYFELLLSFGSNIGNVFRKKLSGDAQTAKALDVAFEAYMYSDNFYYKNRCNKNYRLQMSKFFGKSKMILDFNLLNATLNSARLEMKFELIPKSIQELEINGHDVMEILEINEGSRLGEVLNILLESVYKGEINNNRNELIDKLKNLKN
jgi:tRNA nucleotidyltransferase/poly(A) polymerase